MRVQVQGMLPPFHQVWWRPASNPPKPQAPPCPGAPGPAWTCLTPLAPCLPCISLPTVTSWSSLCLFAKPAVQALHAKAEIQALHVGAVMQGLYVGTTDQLLDQLNTALEPHKQLQL